MSSLKFNWKAMAACSAVSFVVTLGGVLLFFDPIAKKDVAGGALVHPAVGLLVYVALTVGLFDWIARQMRHAFKAAFAVAASQFVLVNVDFVLAGKRGLLTAGASALLMAATWASVALVYSRVVRWDAAAT